MDAGGTRHELGITDGGVLYSSAVPNWPYSLAKKWEVHPEGTPLWPIFLLLAAIPILSAKDEIENRGSASKKPSQV